MEKRYVHADGREIRAETVVALVRDAGGNPTCFTLQLHDITDRCASEKSLRLAALADDLTGLYNRRGFRMVAEHEIRHAARNGNSILVLYIDIDDFKEINDRYGHATGDRALQSVADLLRATLRESDLVGRQGGDEFVALLRCGQDESEATITLRLRRRLRWYNATRMLPFELRLSIGAVRVDAGDRRSIDELLNVADAVLYEAKRGAKRDTKCDAVSHVHRDDRSPV